MRLVYTDILMQYIGKYCSLDDCVRGITSDFGSCLSFVLVMGILCEIQCLVCSYFFSLFVFCVCETHASARLD